MAATYYELLGVAATATTGEINTAYRRLARTAHPDAAGDPALFSLLTEARDVLVDPARRADYDRRLTTPPRPFMSRIRLPRTGAGWTVLALVWLVLPLLAGLALSATAGPVAGAVAAGSLVYGPLVLLVVRALS